MKRRYPIRAIVQAARFLCVCLVYSQATPAACMVKQVMQNGTIVPAAMMIAPEKEVSALLARGFVRADCPKDFSVVRTYVDRLCDDGKASGRLPINTVALIGRSRESACAIARAGLVESSR